VREQPILSVPRAAIIDTSGAGDVFHGAYINAYLRNPSGSWDEHFTFARAASTYKIQHLGNEAGLPTIADIDTILRNYKVAA
jgi:sugar/nucleoside kinase (ribokinase family)